MFGFSLTRTRTLDFISRNGSRRPPRSPLTLQTLVSSPEFSDLPIYCWKPWWIRAMFLVEDAFNFCRLIPCTKQSINFPAMPLPVHDFETMPTKIALCIFHLINCILFLAHQITWIPKVLIFARDHSENISIALIYSNTFKFSAPTSAIVTALVL